MLRQPLRDVGIEHVRFRVQQRAEESQVEEKKGVRPFGLAPTVATKGWNTRPWPFTLRAELAISFRGPVSEEKSNLCYMFGTGDDEEPVEKIIMTSSSAFITS